MRNEKQQKGTGKKKKIYWPLFIAAIFSLPFHATAQSIPTQQLRGLVMDQVLQVPVEGATVTLAKLNRSTTTDEKGAFRFSGVPIGVQQLTVTYVGYKEATLDNINVNSGKETVLAIALENTIRKADVIIVKTNSKRNKPLNDMSSVSARAFTVEETQKYAAAVNDPSRMATGFPGVFATDDGNNNITIRGNSPTGLLWRMEGVDIPNPNHFSSTGGSGGGISILSAQLLSNSDFITGAFASEYGNALSGVFDLRLRKGNNEKREYTLQAGLLGLNGAMEGPLFKNGGSYLVNYRYSTLSLLDKIGVPLEGGTNFQDLSYNIYLPTRKAGNFSLFGFGGLSSQHTKALLDSVKWNGKADRFNEKFISNTGAAGLTHSILLDDKTNLRSVVALSYNKINDNVLYIEDDYSLSNEYLDNFKTKKWTVTSTLNHKFSTRSTLRAGAIANFIDFNYFQKSKAHENAPLNEVINSKDATQTVQGFAQWQYKPFNLLTLNVGAHYLELLYNHTKAIEPRASVKWQVDKNNSIAIGYGGHSQVQALGVYFAQTKSADGKISYPNKDLGLTRAHHYILSYQHSFSRNLAVKAEAYYQQLYKVPVSISDTNTFSVLNIQSEYITDPLANDGKGRNYGLELSVEKYLSNNFYYTVSTSLYQSKYTAKDGVERDTRFNGNYIANLVAGKEIISSNKLKTFGINIKTIYAGGLRNTPVDVDRSVQEGYAIFRQKEAFTEQNPNYFRTDLRVSMKWNRSRLTSTLSLDIQNLSNRQNVQGMYFDSEKGKMVTAYQAGIIPVLNYKIEF
jgi:hypothetical protein